MPSWSGKAPDMFEGVMMPELYLAAALGAVGKPMIRVHTAGSVGGSTAIVASHLVASGMHNRVLTVAFEKQSDSDAMWALSVPQPFASPLLAGAGGYFAPIIRAYMHRSGAPSDIGMKVAVKDRLHALKNPYAHLHLPDIDLKMVEDSIMLWDPLHYLEACPSSDGAAAMIIGSESRRRPSRNRTPESARPGSTAWPCARSPPCSPGGTRSIPRPGGIARPTSTGRRGSPIPGRISTWPRSTSPSAGTSPCGWRTSGFAPKATGGS
jgi:acetyl-CoA acetyltransferase